MIRHRFLNEGRSPIPMGGIAEYACVCGKRGTHESIDLHITESTSPDGSFDDSITKAHYLPMEPREPAPPTFIEEESITPSERPPPRGAVEIEVDVDERPRSIAELFQDMLRAAFQAGAASTTASETFESWYQREVLR